MERNSIKHLLMSSNYFVLNKKLVKILGIETAFFLTSLAEADEMLADEDGWFYQTVPQIEEMTGLSEHKQKKCIDKLISLKILSQENKGMPMKRYFRLDYTQVLNILIPSTQKITDQAPEKFVSMDKKNSGACTKKTHDNKKHNIKNINKELNINISEQLEKENISLKLKEKLKEFIRYRKEIKKSIKTYTVISKMLGQIGTKFTDENHLILSIDDSMANQYQGVFPVKLNNIRPVQQETPAMKMLKAMKGEVENDRY